MLYSSILQIIILTGVGIIVLVLARALPRIEDEKEGGIIHKKNNILTNLFSRISLDKIDNSINHIFHKTLRKTKIIIMKIDNLITNKLKNIHSDNDKKNGPRISDIK